MSEEPRRFEVNYDFSNITPIASPKHIWKIVPPPPLTKVEKMQEYFEEAFMKTLVFLGGCVFIIVAIYIIILFALGIMELLNV
jgi:hypothetical protein